MPTIVSWHPTCPSNGLKEFLAALYVQSPTHPMVWKGGKKLPLINNGFYFILYT